jgi:hypothetical protein
LKILEICIQPKFLVMMMLLTYRQH